VHNVSKLVTRTATPLGRPNSAAAPVIADGMVIVTSYFTTGEKPGEIEAFPDLWQRGGLVVSDPTVAGGEVWAAGGGSLAPATLYAFGLPPAAG
jgi:hypothetical protein